ncbi:MAG: hypothetical protein PHS31_04675 [Victivallaceae bacterium]|nr:hypothetical protein [Victivallaceae bacterium]
MRKIKRIILVVALVLITLAVFVAIAGYFAYRSSVNGVIEAKGNIYLEPDQEIMLGGATAAVATFKSPWSRRPITAEVTNIEGLHQSGTPEFKRQKIRWGWCEWVVRVNLRSYRTGTLIGGKMSVTFNHGSQNTQDTIFEQIVPSCRVRALSESANDQQLKIADAVENSRVTTRERWLVAGLILFVLLIVVLIIILIVKHRRRILVIPPWVQALSDLDLLRSELRGGEVNLESGLSRLSDIVRLYLEKRFKLNTTRQTTAEFMDELSCSNSVLPTAHQPFLSEFMNTADLVKFAKVPPDESMLNSAIDSADKLVSETRPLDGEKTVEEL